MFLPRTLLQTNTQAESKSSRVIRVDDLELPLSYHGPFCQLWFSVPCFSSSFPVRLLSPSQLSSHPLAAGGGGQKEKKKEFILLIMYL